jgi:cytochrome c553
MCRSVAQGVPSNSFPEVLMLTVKNCVRFAVAGLLAASMFVVTGGEAVARPKYKDVLNTTYPDLAKKHGTDGKLTCAVCHPEKDKKKRNNYGVALAGKLEKKNESDLDKIKEALVKTEEEKSKTEGKTFGDLIKDGELPGTEEVAE